MDNIYFNNKMVNFIKDVDEFEDAGSPIISSVSASAKSNGIDEKEMMDTLFNKKNGTSEIIPGSFVTIKGDESNKQYKILNINNKGDVDLCDVATNAVISKPINNLLPVNVEKKMKKINEAQYTVSIDNLETQNADVLSQIFSLAAQAEADSGSMIDTELNAYVNPDMGDAAIVPVGDTATDDTDFVDPELDSNVEIIDAEPIETEVAEIPTVDGTLLEAEEPKTVKVRAFNIDWDCDGENPEDCGLPSEIVLDVEEVDGVDLGDVVADKLSDDTGFLHNGFEYEIVDGLSETPTEETKDADIQIDEPVEEIDDKELLNEKGEENEETDFDDEIAEALRIAGVKKIEESITEPEIVNDETLVINKKDETLDIEAGENQRPEYKEVDTEDVWGKDSSEGTKYPFNLKEMVNVAKIKSICETASKMYKAQSKENWLFLDRRYVSKLMKEGVSYTNASKMLLVAKKGK